MVEMYLKSIINSSEVFSHKNRMLATLALARCPLGNNWWKGFTRLVHTSKPPPGVLKGLVQSFNGKQRTFKNNIVDTNAHLPCVVVRSVTRSTDVTVSLVEGNEWYMNQQWTLQSAELEEVAAVVTTEQAGESVVTSQTVTFTDNEGGAVYEAPTSDNVVALVDNTDDIALGTFLSRPTLLNTYTWSSATSISILQTFNPWQLFLNNTIIKRKIENYAFMRAKMRIKVLVNGTPFQYGAVRVCYRPLNGFVENKVRFAPATNLPELVPYSQMPGFFIYPQANAGGEMELPFFFHKNWLDITSNTEVDGFGQLLLVLYSPLKVANTGASSSVTIRTYGWLTDVKLMGSTVKLTLQADDEYGNGPISKPASALASMASLMTKVPLIGRYARATEIGASAVSRIAAMFGFTNVPVIADVHAYAPMNGPMLASSHIGAPIQKLTLDPKQELSIDPTPHGIGNMDEMALTYLKTKESYFFQVSWSTANTVGTQLFNTRINPWLVTQRDVLNFASATVGKRVWHIPLSYIAALFKHWRGDIIIRMKVVCTKYHKGRLKISYDPIGDISSTDAPENSVYTEILDIGESDDVEFVIPYHQDTAWMEMNNDLNENYTAGLANAPRRGIDNGTITIRVLTALTAPISSTVDLMFFAKGGANFEFANIEEFIGSENNNYTVPSFFPLQAEDKTNVVSTTIMMGQPTLTLPERYALNFGEATHSLRDLLHRSVVVDTVAPAPGTAGAAVVMRKRYARMPYTPGYQTPFATSALNVVAGAGGFGYAFNGMHPMPYVAGMYLGYRGGTNYTVTPCTDQYNFMDDIRVTRITSNFGLSTNTPYLDSSTTLTDGSSLSARALFYGRGQHIRDGTSGLAITSNRTNASVQFMIPDYNRFNFSLVNPSLYPRGSTEDGTVNQGALLSYTPKRPTSTEFGNTTISVMSAAAAAPDFTCLYFLCCPTLDFQLAAPTPV
nr:MAG: hypothetical protein 2 [Marnaviridae sp.]